jgi:hypothetical protein
MAPPLQPSFPIDPIHPFSNADRLSTSNDTSLVNSQIDKNIKNYRLIFNGVKGIRRGKKQETKRTGNNNDGSSGGTQAISRSKMQP